MLSVLSFPAALSLGAASAHPDEDERVQTSLRVAVKTRKCLGPPPILLLASACIGSAWPWEVQNSTLQLQHRTEKQILDQKFMPGVVCCEKLRCRRSRQINPLPVGSAQRCDLHTLQVA